jgi:formamidopyrimidine-DNA glycosylase
MPELPEVETIRRQLVTQLRGQAVTTAWGHSSSKFSESVDAVGAAIEDVTRRGKYLILALDDDRELVVHLGMTGSLRVAARDVDESTDPYVRAWWDLSDGRRLVFRDVRRFGRIAVLDPGDRGRLPTLAALGPEPFDEAFDGDHLWRALRGHRRHLKTQLLSQRPVAGLGNIYADEALWDARVNPADRTISRSRAGVLRDAIRVALASGLEHGGTTLRDYVDAAGDAGSNQHNLRCYGRSGEPCERCGTELRRTMLDARSTTWCPQCQPRRS